MLISVSIDTLLIHTTASNLLSMIEQLRSLEYPSAQLKQFVESLNLDNLIAQYDHMQHTNLALLYKMLRVLKDISALKARMFLEKMPLEFWYREQLQVI